MPTGAKTPEIIAKMRATHRAKAAATADERFAASFIVQDGPLPTPCHVWQGCLDKDRYGWWSVENRSLKPHRWAYERWVGAIPAGLVIDHLCNNPSCVNPCHLQAVTQRENVLRGTGITAWHLAKTHCHRGHEFSPENTYVATNGGRVCKTCRKGHMASYREKRKVAVNQ